MAASEPYVAAVFRPAGGGCRNHLSPPETVHNTPVPAPSFSFRVLRLEIDARPLKLPFVAPAFRNGLRLFP